MVTDDTENEVAEEVTNSGAQNQGVADSAIQNIEVGSYITLPGALKLRVIPSSSATEKIELAQGESIIVKKVVGNWCKVETDTQAGWIVESNLNSLNQPVTEPESPETISEAPEDTNTVENETIENTTEENDTVDTNTAEVKQKTGIVIVETARVRKSASSSAEIVNTLDEDTIVTITGEEGDFYKISTSTISEGYVSKSLIREKDVTSRSTQEERENTVNLEANQSVNDSLSSATNTSTTGNDIVAFAKQYLGYPYVLGASSPEKGFDCSGFTRYVFGHFGYSLSQVAASQASNGVEVSRNDLQPGDLLLFYDDAKTKIGHVGIYIGGGDFIHSANLLRGVVIDTLHTNSYYNTRFVTARRIV